jgi:glucosamine--fructose-6-phosphate aminotransferase (isomerizing)
MSIHTEIFEQPDTMQNLLAKQQAEVSRIASEIRRREVGYVFLAARGTSDNAGRYANYLWGAHNGLPVALAAPSLFTFYGQPPHLKGALVVGVSQSGQSPDVVSVVAEGKKQGCLTLAITNAPDSPLAQTADLVIDVQAGVERAVAATKTYTAELMAMAMLSVALAGDQARGAELGHVPDWARQILGLEEQIERIAERYRYMERCVVIGRGFNYATAFEWSLKLKELTYVVAEPYSSADFQHGPIAMVERGFPVMAVAPRGAVYDSILPLLALLREQHRAELLVISDSAEALALAQSPIRLPSGIPEWLTPLVAILPAQLFCYHLTRAKGYDTEAPRTIRKVTETH